MLSLSPLRQGNSRRHASYGALSLTALVGLVTLTFDLVRGSLVTRVNGFHPANLELSRPFRSWVSLRHVTDRLTDRHQPLFHNAAAYAKSVCLLVRIERDAFSFSSCPLLCSIIVQSCCMTILQDSTIWTSSSSRFFILVFSF